MWLVPWLVVAAVARGAQAGDRPVVGVLAQEAPPEVAVGRSLVAAAYVKAVEAAGARVAPVFINRTRDYYQGIMNSINGLVLPGGSTNFSTPGGFAAAGRLILELAYQLQDRGVSFPLLGVCQGFELFMFLEANVPSSTDVLVLCEAKNVALPLVFKPGFQESRLYQAASTEVLDILRNLPVTSNHHRWCMTEAALRARNLEKKWRVLSTNKDSRGLEFISSTEHFYRPVVGVQFHPEKNMYEWNSAQANPHSRKAVLSARLFYDWLVAESRNNNNSFPSAGEEQAALIYNYSPSYTGRQGGYDEQVYFF